MTPRINVTPNPAPRGSLVAVDGWCLTQAKYDLVTVDAANYVAGTGSNGTRPNPDGAFSRGILLPASGSACKVQVRRGKSVVASVDVRLTA